MLSAYIELINSLNQAEKRYFKLFAQRHSKKDLMYLKLYDLIEKKQYTKESEVWDKLPKKRNNKYWTETDKTSLKSYLYKMILKSLRAYHEEISVERRINNLLFEARILEKKRFFAATLKQLKIASKLAKKYEYFSLLLEIISLQKKLVLIHQSINPDETFSKLHQDWTNTHQTLKTNNTVRSYYEKCFSFFQNKNASPKELEQLNHSFQKYWNKIKSKKELSFNARLNQSIFVTFYLVMTKKYKKRKKEFKKIFDLFDKYPHFKKEHFMLYIGLINNEASNYVHLLEMDGLKKADERLDSLRPNSVEQKIKILDCHLYIKLIYHLTKEEYAEVKELIHSVENDLKLHSSKFSPSRRLMFFFNFAQSCYLLKEGEESSKWIREIYNIKPKTLRPDIQIRTRVLEILNTFDPQNFSLFESLTESAIRFVKKYRDENPKELALLHCFKKIAANPQNIKTILNESKDLIVLLEDWNDVKHWMKMIITSNSEK